MKIAKKRSAPASSAHGRSLSLHFNLILYASVILSVVALALLNAGDDGAAAVAVGSSVMLCVAGFVALRHAVVSPLNALRAYIDQMDAD